MAERPDSDISYRSAPPPGAGNVDVLVGDVVVGRVGRFHMGAGQFGSRWVATTPQGERSTKFGSRDAAARWLVGRAGPSELD